MNCNQDSSSINASIKPQMALLVINILSTKKTQVHLKLEKDNQMTKNIVKMNGNEQTTKSVMLLLKQRASNVDQLLKKQKKLEILAKEMKQENHNLKEQILMKEKTITELNEKYDQMRTEHLKNEEIINDNKILEAALKKKEIEIADKEKIICSKTKIIIQKDNDLEKKVEIIEIKNNELAKNETLLQSKDDIIAQRENLIQSQADRIKILEKQIKEMSNSISNKQFETDENILQRNCQKSKITHEMEKCDKSVSKNNRFSNTCFQGSNSKNSIFDIVENPSNVEDDTGEINDRYRTPISDNNVESNDASTSGFNKYPILESTNIDDSRSNVYQNHDETISSASLLLEKSATRSNKLIHKEDRTTSDLHSNIFTGNGLLKHNQDTKNLELSKTSSYKKVTLKFVAPVRKKWMKRRDKCQKKIVQFSKAGQFDVYNRMHVYKHNVKLPHDLLNMHDDYVALGKSTNNLMSTNKAEQNISLNDSLSAKDEKSAMTLQQEEIQKDKESTSRPLPVIPINAQIQPKMKTNQIRSSGEPLKALKRKIEQGMKSESTQRKRKNCKLLDVQEKEMHHSAKTALNAQLSTKPSSSLSPNTLSRDLPSRQDIWNPKRFAEYDTENTKKSSTNVDARARAVAILTKSPRKQSVQKKPGTIKAAAQLEDDLSISDSSDQECSSPLKLNEKSPIKKIENQCRKFKDNSEITEMIEKDQNEPPFKPTLRYKNSSGIDNDTNTNSATPDKKRKKTEKYSEITDLVSISTTQQNPLSSENIGKTKNFKHKKFDSVEYVPLGQSYSTLTVCTERAASSYDKSSRTLRLENNDTQLVNSSKMSSILPGSSGNMDDQQSFAKTSRQFEKEPKFKYNLKTSSGTLITQVLEDKPNPRDSEISNENTAVPKNPQNTRQNTEFHHSVAKRTNLKEDISNKIPETDKYDQKENQNRSPTNHDLKSFSNQINMGNVPLNDSNPTPDIDYQSKYALEVDIRSILRNQKETYLGYMMRSFKNYKKEKQALRESRRNAMKSSNIINDDISINLVKSQLGRLWKPSSQSTIENIVQQLVKLYNKSNNTGMSFRYLLIQSIYMEIRDEKNWEDIAEVANFAPLMTEKQAKILALLIKLEQAPTEVHEKPQTPALIIDELLRFIRYSIFGKDGGGLPRMQTFKISQLANLTRLFMALVRFKGDEKTARMFLFDIMFFRNPRSHVLINVFFDTWPEILFWTGKTDTVIDPLLETVIWMIYNTGPSTSLTDMKVHESRLKLKELCGFPKPPSTGDELIKHLIDKTEKSIESPFLKHGTCKSLLLLAKWQEWKWSHNHIISRLLEVMRKCLESENKEKDMAHQLLTWVVDCIGNVSRVYPAEGRERLLEIFEPIKSILTDNEKAILLTAELEESCLRSLIWTGHHLQVQVAEFLISWKPKHPQSQEVIDLVTNFVGTRGEKYCQTTIKVQKKKSIYETLNAQVTN